MQTQISGRYGCNAQRAGAWSGHVAANPIRPVVKVCRSAAVASAVTAPEDKWLARTVKEVPTPAGLSALREKTNAALGTLRMPTSRNEEYRYTDIAPLLKRDVQVAAAGAAVPESFVAAHTLPDAQAMVVLVDGRMRPELSRGLDSLPKGVYVGPLAGAPAAAVEKLGSLSGARGGPFAVLNGALVQEVVVVHVPNGKQLLQPVYVLHVASGQAPAEGVLPACAPRLLLSAGSDSRVELVEEYVGLGAAGAADHVTVSISELFLERDAHVKHSYVQREPASAYHFKGTLVAQDERSNYTVTEATMGGAIARHDLGIQQHGPETHTEMGHFLLCGPGQLHDLHSKLVLDHPNGTAKQLHKCIVSHASGRGVFDGNVQVNRLAQKTDAGQLSRNLLLVPLATVNVKPNLQIIADDVKCTHGCAVSDLRDDELFYFRARGISAEAARQALVFSFGAEVVQRMGHKPLVARVQEDTRRTLASVEALAGSAV